MLLLKLQTAKINGKPGRRARIFARIVAAIKTAETPQFQLRIGAAYKACPLMMIASWIVC
jgi:hypothetical protein